MLKKANRLSRTDFVSYFKVGKRLHSDYATLIWHPHPTFHGSVVVSKKVSKKAVVRNTIRRRIYSALYNLKPATGVFIVVVKPTYNTLTKQAAQTEIKSLIGRIVKTA